MFWCTNSLQVDLMENIILIINVCSESVEKDKMVNLTSKCQGNISPQNQKKTNIKIYFDPSNTDA